MTSSSKRQFGVVDGERKAEVKMSFLRRLAGLTLEDRISGRFRGCSENNRCSFKGSAEFVCAFHQDGSLAHSSQTFRAHPNDKRLYGTNTRDETFWLCDGAFLDFPAGVRKQS